MIIAGRALLVGVLPLLLPLAADIEPGAAQEEKGTLDFQLRMNVAVIPVEVNGARRLFVLDTGAYATFIGKKAARDLRLPVLPGRVDGAPHGEAFGPPVRVRSLEVAGIRVTGMTAGTLDMTDLREVLGEDVSGILGSDFLSRGRVTIDYPRGKVTFDQRKDPSPDGDDDGGEEGELLEETRDFQLRGDLVLVEAEINGVGRLFVVDTGASGTVVEKRAVRELGLKEVETSLSRGADGDAVGSLVRIDSLKVGGVEFSDISAHTMDDPDSRESLGEGFSGILGFNVLSRFKLTIDYPRRKVTFQRRVEGDEEREDVVEGDRFSSARYGISLQRPDSSWTFVTEVPSPRTLVQCSKKESTGRLEVQIQEARGVPLERLLPMVESALRARVGSFEEISSSHREVSGVEARQIDFLGEHDGAKQRFRYVAVVAGGTLFGLVCESSPADFGSLEAEFEEILESVKLSGEE